MKFFLFLLATFFLTQCSHWKPQPKDYSQDRFWAEQQARAKQLSSISGSFRLSYRGKEEKASGSGQFVTINGDKTRIEVRDPLGRVQYLVIKNGRNFIVHYPRLKEAIVEKEAGAAYLKSLVSFSLDFKQLQLLLVGSIGSLVTKKKFSSWQWDGKKGVFHGLVSLRGQSVRVSVDPKLNTIRSLLLPQSKLIVEYGDFKWCCRNLKSTKLRFANSVTITHDALDTSISVRWKKINELPKKLSPKAFRQKLPKGTRKFLLKSDQL